MNVGVEKDEIKIKGLGLLFFRLWYGFFGENFYTNKFLFDKPIIFVGCAVELNILRVENFYIT